MMGKLKAAAKVGWLVDLWVSSMVARLALERVARKAFARVDRMGDLQVDPKAATTAG